MLLGCLCHLYSNKIKLSGMESSIALCVLTWGVRIIPIHNIHNTHVGIESVVIIMHNYVKKVCRGTPTGYV